MWGAPAECVTALSHVVAAGADLIILNPVFDEREQIERLAQEVIPSLQERLPPF